MDDTGLENRVKTFFVNSEDEDAMDLVQDLQDYAESLESELETAKDTVKEAIDKLEDIT